MITVNSASELKPLVGDTLGYSDWTSLPADKIAAFGSLTGDEHWVHVDRERARHDGPFGDVIAHGFYALSLVTGLANQCYQIHNAQRWTNYGLDRVRFTAPVLPDDLVRLKLSLKDLSLSDSGAKLVLTCELEKQGSPRPAFVADWIVLVSEGETE